MKYQVFFQYTKNDPTFPYLVNFLPPLRIDDTNVCLVAQQ